MTKLKELQERFLTDLIHLQSNELAYIKSSDQLSAAERLKIYHESMIEGFIVTLLDTFPVCCKIVGEAFFRAMAKEYALSTASLSPDLGDYGATFAAFINNFTPAKSLPYLADVAAYEWAHYCITHADESAFRNFSELASVPERQYKKLYFQLTLPSFLEHSSYPLQRIWEIHQDNFSGEFAVDLAPSTYYFLIWKKQGDVNRMTLTKQQWDFLQAIKQQKTLASFSEAQLPLLAEAVKLGWISDFMLRS